MSTLVVINNHDGGMVNDPRDPRTNVVRNIQHFDNYTNPRKLTPYRSLVVETNDVSTLNSFQIKRFVQGAGQLWGLGVYDISASPQGTAIYTKTSPGFPSDAWQATGGDAPSATESYLMFVLYHNYLYGSNTGGVWKYGDITGSPSFTSSDYISNVCTGQGIVHSADDILYFPSNNLVIYNNNGSYGVGFTLPAQAKITSLCEFGNYLAMGYNMPDGSCVVGFWDRDFTNTTLSEKIDWGMGNLQFIETVEGTLIGCSIFSDTTNATAIIPRIFFKSYEYSYLSGSYGLNTVNIFAEFVTSSMTINSAGNDGKVVGSQQKVNELLYFLAEMGINGISYAGLWKIFRNAAGQMAISFDQLPQNGTAIGAGILYGFLRWGDYIFIALQDSAGNNTIWRTNDQLAYIATSQVDTTINQGMTPEDQIELKQLMAVGALYEPLPSGASVVVQYRVDGGSWTTIFTETTTGQVRTEPYTQTAASGQFTAGYEYEFRVQSTGGAEITALIYKYDTKKTHSNS